MSLAAIRCSAPLSYQRVTNRPGRHAPCKALGVRLRATGGFALVDLLFVCGIIGVLAVIAMPRLLLAKQSASAASAIGSLRTVGTSELTFALTCGGGFYAQSLTALGTAPPGSTEAFITPALGASNVVTHSDYILQLSGTPYPGSPPTCNGLATGAASQAYKAGADPDELGNPRFFATNSDGQIYEDLSSLYALMPEAGSPPAGHLLQ
jgi:type II secretory pathway pseudopilin PulG